MADKAPVMDLRDAEPVAIRETPNARGARRSRVLRNRLGEELSSARRASGLSLREVGRRVEAGHEMVARVERGDPTAMSIDLAARIAEAETHLGDIQAIERRIGAKGRDLGADRLILLVADTRHNRSAIAAHPEIREQFPVDTRTCLMRLGRGFDPGGNCLVIL